MEKIDETKQYKFSEIIAMLENGELPEGTVLENGFFPEFYEVGESSFGFTLFEHKGYKTAPILCDRLINYLWTIRLPKLEKYYLQAPARFAKGSSYLNYNEQTKAYFLGSVQFEGGYQTQFTKSEISAMPFDTSFFGEPIEAEVD